MHRNQSRELLLQRTFEQLGNWAQGEGPSSLLNCMDLFPFAKAAGVEPLEADFPYGWPWEFPLLRQDLPVVERLGHGLPGLPPDDPSP